MDTDNIALTNIQFKWSVGLNDEIQLDTLTKALKNAKNILLLCIDISFNSNYFSTVKLSISHKMGISLTPNCLYCNNI